MRCALSANHLSPSAFKSLTHATPYQLNPVALSASPSLSRVFLCVCVCVLQFYRLSCVGILFFYIDERTMPGVLMAEEERVCYVEGFMPGQPPSLP